MNLFKRHFSFFVLFIALTSCIKTLEPLDDVVTNQTALLFTSELSNPYECNLYFEDAARNEYKVEIFPGKSFLKLVVAPGTYKMSMIQCAARKFLFEDGYVSISVQPGKLNYAGKFSFKLRNMQLSTRINQDTQLIDEMRATLSASQKKKFEVIQWKPKD